MRIQPLQIKVHLYRETSPDGRLRVPVSEVFNFRIRTLNRREFQAWNLDSLTPSDFEEKILQNCVLEYPDLFRGYPWDWNQVYAGVVAQVIDKIINLSGFGAEPDPDVIQKAQDYIQSEEAKYDLIIMTAFNYKLEELMEMDSDIWHRLAGLAQTKIAMLGIDPDVILDPEGFAKKAPHGGNMPPGGVPPHQTRGFPTAAKPYKPGVEWGEESEGQFAFFGGGSIEG